uniref:Uncharacterized protein n=1 Tax=viral metagenome TaxID=1070528 RepID=A0A6C0DK39_9ZZZZ
MNYDIEELKIMLYTNIQKNRLLPFTRKLLSHPEISTTNIDLNDYPYFTFDVKYPKGQMQYLRYQERIEIFFNKQLFSEYLFAYSKKPLVSKDNENYYKERDEIIEHNIMTMIEILFPTKFPVITDIHTSYDKIIGKTSLHRMILNPIKPKYFSYLNISGKDYTFKKSIWLNDFLNHPLYRKLLEDYRKFWVWSLEEKARWKTVIDKEIKNNINILEEIFKEVDSIKINTPFDITKIPKTIQAAYFFYKYINYYYIDFYLNKNVNDTVNAEIYEKINNDLEKFMTMNRNDINEVEEKLASGNKKTPIRQTGGAKKKSSISTSTKRDTTDVETIKQEIDQLCYDNITDEMNIIDKIELLFKIINNFRNENWIKISKSTNFAASNNSIDKINSLFNKIISPERMNIAYGNYKQVLDMVKYPYDQLRDENFRNENYNNLENIGTKNKSPIKITLPAEYKNFAYNTLTLFKRPQRETTNASLQNLINSFESNTTTELYLFLEKIYNFYMRNSGEKISDDEKKLLNVGLNYINTNITESGVRREIYIMSDFIEGQVDEKNMNSIYCPFIGEHLGNEFKFLVRMAQGGKLNNTDINFWAVDRNRMIFSLTTLELKEIVSNKEQELKATEMKPDMYYQNNVSTNVKNIEMIPFKSDEQKNKQPESTELPGIDSWFYNEIINPNEKEIEKLVNEINYFGISNLVIRDIFDNIIKKTELYNIIKEWFSNKYKYSSELISSMIMLSSKYDGKIKDIANKMNEQKNRLNTEALNKLNYESKFYTLLKTIVDKLMINERNKNQLITSALTGGNNFSRKNKKKHFINITRKTK